MKLMLLAVAILCSFASCSSSDEDDFVLNESGGAKSETDSDIPVPEFTNEQKWAMVGFEIWDFRMCMVEKTWTDETGNWVRYNDVDGFDFGDWSDGTPDTWMDIPVDNGSFSRLKAKEHPIDAFLCRDCGIWHIHFDGYTYSD